MKKKILALTILALIFVLVLGPVTAAAEETDAVTAAELSGASAGPAAPKAVSLEDALISLEGSAQMELIKMQHLGDQAAARGSKEALNSIKNAEKYQKQLAEAYDTYNAAAAAYAAAGDAEQAAAAARSANTALSISVSIDLSSKPQVALMQTFATSMVDANDEARRNALDLSATEMYYQLKQIEAQAAIAADNYDITKAIYDQTALKYKLGTVSRMDLLSAETNLTSAKDASIAAANGLEQVRMGFNIFFGYGLTDKVELTTELGETPISSISLEEGIASALENRNEIKAAQYALDQAKLNYSSYTAYPRNSSAYTGAYARLLAAQTSCDMAPMNIEMEVRTNHMAMNAAYEAVKTADTTVANAIETVRLATLQYEKGYCTLTTLQQAQLGSYSAQLARVKALLDLKLAVEKYELSTGVGTSAASLS